MAKKEFLNFNRAILLLFIIAIVIIIKTALSPQQADIVNEAEIVLTKLTNGYEKISLLSSEELSEEKLRSLDEMDYNEIKNILGIKSDFCVYFEDVTGNIVRIDDINLGIGSDKIYINGEPCR